MSIICRARLSALQHVRMVKNLLMANALPVKPERLHMLETPRAVPVL